MALPLSLPNDCLARQMMLVEILGRASRQTGHKLDTGSPNRAAGSALPKASAPTISSFAVTTTARGISQGALG